jgi:hypothetical protein
MERGQRQRSPFWEALPTRWVHVAAESCNDQSSRAATLPNTRRMSVLKPRACYVLVLVLTIACTDTTGREHIVACPGCEIAVDTVAVLGTADGSAALGDVSYVSVDSLDRFWVFSPGELPQVFAPDGTWLLKAGAEGRGPGEFVGASRLVPLPGDSVLVEDANGFHLFDGDLRYQRTLQGHC